MSSDNQNQTSKKRPKLVWLISIFYIISVGYTLLSFVIVYNNFELLGETEKAYFNSQSSLDYFSTILTGLLNMAGAILLFLLKRNAYICFLSAFILGIITTVFHIFFKNWLEVIGGAGLVGAAIGWSISIAIILYSKKLIKKEILK